jgi:hypothetical protein
MRYATPLKSKNRNHRQIGKGNMAFAQPEAARKMKQSANN